MRRSVQSAFSLSFSILAIAILAIAMVVGCSSNSSGPPGEPDSGGPSSDAAPGTDATTAGDAGNDGASPVSEAGLDASDAAVSDASETIDASGGPYLLLSYFYDGYNNTEYSAFNVASASVQGGLSYAQYGVNVSTNTTPWVLEQYSQLVLRMDPKQPWNPTSSWSLASLPNGSSYGNDTDAFAVAEVGTKAYVLGYGSNYIAVLDTSTTYDAGAPIETIPLVANADAGPELEGIALAYDASQNVVWVVLGNSNGVYSDSVDGSLCGPDYHPFVIAIDTTSDEVVSGLQYTLQGYGTPDATHAVVFDSANDRLLIATEGCYDPVDAGEAGIVGGAFDEAYIEQISLAPGADANRDTVLLTLSPSNSPAALVYVDETHAFVQTGNGPTYAWNPTQQTLGAEIPNAPDTFVWDGRGHLLGPQSTALADAGISIAVVAVNPADGGLTTLATNPFTPVPASGDYGGPWQSIDIWPHP
jgi:hypothetical protein